LFTEKSIRRFITVGIIRYEFCCIWVTFANYTRWYLCHINIVCWNSNINKCVTTFKYILGIIFKIIVFFIITLVTYLYVRVGIVITCRKHLHDCIISLRGRFRFIKLTRLIPTLLLKCLYQARKVSGHVHVC